MKNPKTERVPVMWDRAFLDKIDDFRFQNRIGSRSAAVRKLVELGLRQQAKKKEKAGPPATA